MMLPDGPIFLGLIVAYYLIGLVYVSYDLYKNWGRSPLGDFFALDNKFIYFGIMPLIWPHIMIEEFSR